VRDEGATALMSAAGGGDVEVVRALLEHGVRNPDPPPYTLHPTPYTLHPTPYNLHSPPYTLHLPPSALRPTP